MGYYYKETLSLCSPEARSLIRAKRRLCKYMTHTQIKISQINASMSQKMLKCQALNLNSGLESQLYSVTDLRAWASCLSSVCLWFSVSFLFF